MTHCTDVCLCGAVQYQCDCPGWKPERVVQHTCARCVRDEPRKLLGGVAFAPSTFEPTEMCIDEDDAQSNRDVRLAVYEVVAGLEAPMNPQLLLARVHEKIEVPDRWKQLARDLISEANGELRLAYDRVSLVLEVDPAEMHAVADEVIAGRGYITDPGDKMLGNLVAIVMKKMQGRADPGSVRDYLRSKLAS